MRSMICIALLAMVALASACDEKPIYDLNKAPELFEKFIKDYDRHYKDAADKQVHYEAFVEALKEINKNNEDESNATFGINKFSDYTKEELKQIEGFIDH